MKLRHAVKRALSTVCFMTAGATLFSLPFFSARAEEYVVIDAAEAAKIGAAAGGDEIRQIDNGDSTLDIVHLFTSTGTSMSFTVPAENMIKPGTLRMLVVGGGGSGGGDCGGGGGAGGLIYLDNLSAASAVVNVGAGGAATTSKEMGKDGSPTTIQFGGTTYTALGGGGGAWWSGTNGRSGGSGGGAVQGNGNGTVGAAQQPTSTSGGYGNAGATSAVNNAGGGGGGAGGAGNTDGSGGSGMAYDISGETTYYAAGGGGGCDGTRSTSVGGSGVGGNGSHSGSKGATDGVAGTGSGGGGDGGGSLGTGSFTSRSGAGGSGVVILRYTVETSPILSTGAIRKQVGGDMVLIFTNVDQACSFTLKGMAQGRILAVGGGGAGGSGTVGNTVGAGAGGGAGGFVEREMIFEASTYSVTIGKGGAAAIDNSNKEAVPGNSGSDSYIKIGDADVVRALGGGGGGFKCNGAAGGSGGGASKVGTAGGSALQPVSAFGGKGNAGGASGSYNQAAGGGGGAGESGYPATAMRVSGNGGAGLSSSITGEECWYAGGGGGGAKAGTNTHGGVGGLGGGGNGGDGNADPTSGVDGLGAGGGGCSATAPAGKGGDGIIVVRISAVLDGPIVKPTSESIVYDGELHTKIPQMDFAYTITGTASAKDVGIYALKVVLKDGFCWNGDPADTDPVEISWSITQAPNAITDLYQPNWLTGETPSTPTCHVDFGTPVYTYSTEENGEYVALDLASLGRGEYWVKATIKETANYDGAEAKASFRVVAGPSESFVYRTSFAVAGTDGTSTLTNFPVLLRLDKSNVGFDYAEIRQARDAGELSFADNTGAYLPYEIDTWNENGESLIWVRLNELSPLGATISMYWGLRDGYSVEPNNPQAVWTDFAGVWHMNEVILAGRASSTKSSDSTAGKHDATPQKGTNGNLTQMVSTNAVVGLGRINSSVKSCLNGNRLATGSPFNLGSKFTFSGWYRFSGVDSGTHPRLVGNKKGNKAPGWSIETAAGNAELLYVRANLSDPTSYINKNDNLYNDWVYLAFVFDGDKSTLYSNGRYVNTVTITPVADAEEGMNLCFGANADGTEYSLNGSYDELRITPAALSADWIKTDYEQMRAGSVPTHGPIYDGRVARNGWKVLPSLSKANWDEGEEAATYEVGEPLLGTPSVSFRIMPTGVETNEMPTVRGNYQIVFTVPAAEDGSYDGMEYAIDFAIVDHSPYNDVDGASGANGRILLMNRDVGDNNHPLVDYQGYYDNAARYASTEGATFWEYCNDDATSQYNLLAGTSFTLWTANYRKKLWHLEDCRHGNTFPTSNTASLIDGQNYLPWSTTSKRITAHNNQKVTRATVGWCNMLNTTDACIYSSCFEDGIGTIYFDAVNGWTGNADKGVYGLIVEVATNVVNGTEAPTDENIREEIVDPDITYDPETGITTTNGVVVTTNYYAKGDWKPVTAILLKRDYPADYAEEKTFVKETASGEFQLSITNGATVDNFYRIYIPLNYHCPARFRIRRTTMDPAIASKDGRALILIDNIIASYPTMRADLSSYGIFDESKGGKQILGQEAAWVTPFPSIGDDSVLARAKPEYYVNGADTNADTSAFVTAAKIHYRWRYLDQKIGAWKTSSLDPKNDFKAVKPLELPSIPGDIEYWYETNLQTPFYQYVDYSGTNLGVPGYTEEILIVTNRASGVKFDSQGTDWFVRLREGKSDYEALNLLVRRFNPEGTEVGVTNVVEMELIGNHVWRGYLQTLSSSVGSLLFKVEAKNLQEPGSKEWRENVAYWRNSEEITTLPVSGTLVASSEEEWTRMPCDATTGYLLFQIDDSTHSLTIVHADYQNFNAWNDANENGLFVGSSTEDEGKAGASPKAIECTESFNEWVDMPATNEHWQETFTTTVAQEYPDYTTFPSTTTPNGWNAGQGQLVYGLYKDKDSGRALQMAGQGFGYLQFVDAAEAPRGLESISFTARLAQSINFSDFAYYDAESKLGLHDYTFNARTAFDLNGCNDFTGNASLSLIAYYRPGKGCYEFRYEQQYAAKSTGESLTGKIGGPKKQGQVLSLYRWSYDKATGRLNTTLLGSLTNTTGTANAFDHPKCEGTAYNYQPMYISVSNSADGVTCIMAGVCRTGIKATDTLSTMAAKEFYNVCYRDKSAQRLTSGTYGVLSANCNGQFIKPYKFSKPIAFLSNFTDDNKPFNSYTKNTIPFYTTDATDCTVELNNDLWVIPPGRMESFDESVAQCGVRALKPSQELNIYTGTAGKTDWKLLAKTSFNSFGTSKPVNFNLYTTKDCSVKIAAAGSLADLRTDLIIDDVVLKQWRGDDYKNKDKMVKYIPHWQEPSDIKGHTNFTFTSCWIKNESILMSAKRTIPGTPCAIQSPLFDGNYNRGLGLGMFSFNYENAQENVNLILQIATNVAYDVVNNIDNLDTNTWVNVTNFTFTAADKAKGVRSAYVGLHGVKGVMRLVMDPIVVGNVRNTTDTAKFGEIYITDVFCRDEPVLDSGSWWGWNLRTLGVDNSGKDSEHRMYLPDLTTVASKLGLSLALNNSVKDGVDDRDNQTYLQHVPFLQTPTFTSNIVGEVTFRARKYNPSDKQPAYLALFGSKTGDENGEWHRLEIPDNDLGVFIISNDTFSTYSYKTEPGQAYNAFRLAVTGVKDVTDPHMSNALPKGYDQPYRVLIDEVLVSEAVRARVAFRHVGAFRHDLMGTGFVPDVPSEKEQPMCNESWGVECEVYAAQLPDEIDFSRNPRVRLWWYAGEYPWGFESWKTNKLAKSAWLARATGTNLVYRSSYQTAQDAVIPMSTAPGSVVQYMLEVEYYQVGASSPLTNYLSATDWSTPSWYKPVDLNRDHGYSDFSAYNILDTVAPHWAWINEVNIFGDYDYNYDNVDKNKQFVEIAVPAEADITGWKVTLLEPQKGTDSVITNVLGVFGAKELEPTKPGLRNMASNMVFRVLACESARSSRTLSYDDGTLDGVWSADYPTTVFTAAGEISAINPIGFQLIRASGILEHEIVTIGTNWWNDLEYYRDQYHPSNTVKYLNKHMAGSSFTYVGDDDGGLANSLGVINERGRTTNVWTRAMHHTPGSINEGQNIDPDHPTPNGSSVLIYANLDMNTGHIYQTVGEGVNTNGSLIIAIPKGSERGTNITYRVDPWFVIGTVTTNGKETVSRALAEPRTYQVTVGVGASNNVTVVASAKLNDRLVDLGLVDDNKYKPAVVDWLVKGEDAYGNPWANYGDDEVRLADILRLDDTVVTNMTLTQMYWLDMDPTVGNLALKAGFSSPALPKIRENFSGHTVTNIQLAVKMMITNRTEDVSDTNGYGKAWTPYVLRGLEPGSLSWDYSDTAEWGWTSVTFKVTGILWNGLTSESNPEQWIPLRWFVFKPDSFYQPGEAKAFTSEIELIDPYGTETPGYGAGWYDWVREHGPTPIYYSWSLDTRLKPFGIEVLKKNNYYDFE